jgi:hypothetical protein
VLAGGHGDDAGEECAYRSAVGGLHDRLVGRQAGGGSHSPDSNLTTYHRRILVPTPTKSCNSMLLLQMRLFYLALTPIFEQTTEIRLRRFLDYLFAV